MKQSSPIVRIFSIVIIYFTCLENRKTESGVYFIVNEDIFATTHVHIVGNDNRDSKYQAYPLLLLIVRHCVNCIRLCQNYYGHSILRNLWFN